MKPLKHTLWQAAAGLLGLFLFTASLQAETALTDRFRRHYFEYLADQFYLTREIPGHLLQAIENYRLALRYAGEGPGIHWKITRCYWVLATKRTANREEQQHFFKEGMQHGLKAIETDPQNANAFLWNALIHGNHALEQGVMNALYMRNRLKTWLDRALELDGNNVNALLGMAGWYFYVPEFFGGNKYQSYRLIEQAEAVDPNYTAILVQKAQYQIAEGDYAAAVETLNRILRLPNPTLRNDGLEDKATAREWLARLKQEGKTG